MGTLKADMRDKFGNHDELMSAYQSVRVTLYQNENALAFSFDMYDLTDFRIPASKPTEKRGGEWEIYRKNGQRYFETKGPGINMHVARIGVQGRFSTNNPTLPNINIGGFFGINGETVTDKLSQNHNHTGKELPLFEGLDDEFFNQFLIGIERKR